jgi:hypothetical protein
MKLTTLGVSLLAGALLSTGGDAVATEPRYGVCLQQIEDYVRQRLGQTVEHIRVNSYAERTTITHPGDALVFVEECDGFHGFEIFGTESVCEHLAHYGSGAYYVRYEGAYEGCKRAP